MKTAPTSHRPTLHRGEPLIGFILGLVITGIVVLFVVEAATGSDIGVVKAGGLTAFSAVVGTVGLLAVRKMRSQSTRLLESRDSLQIRDQQYRKVTDKRYVSADGTVHTEHIEESLESQHSEIESMRKQLDELQTEVLDLRAEHQAKSEKPPRGSE